MATPVTLSVGRHATVTVPVALGPWAGPARWPVEAAKALTSNSTSTLSLPVRATVTESGWRPVSAPMGSASEGLSSDGLPGMPQPPLPVEPLASHAHADHAPMGPPARRERVR